MAENGGLPGNQALVQSATGDIGDIGNIAKLNPYGLKDTDWPELEKTRNELAEQLEKRYENPNWFKVAAGFAKPQLGGFIASLGSASQALGETEEQRRAQQLPLAKYRAETQALKIGYGQRVQQKELFNDWLGKNKRPDGTYPPMDNTTYSKIVALDDKSPVAIAAKGYYDAQSSAANTAALVSQGTRADPNFPSILDQLNNPSADPDIFKQQQKKITDNLNAQRPRGITEERWSAMTRGDQLNAVSDYNKKIADASLTDDQIQKKRAYEAPDNLVLLREARDLALGAGIQAYENAKGEMVSGQQQMGQLLDMFKGNNPAEVLAKAFAEGRLTEKLKDLDKSAIQLNASEDARNQFQVLAKLLATNALKLRGSTTNPTDAFGYMASIASPNIDNSQKALVTILDLLGHAEKNEQEKWNVMIRKNIPYGRLVHDDDYKELIKNYSEEHRKIAHGNPLMNAPEWYDPIRFRNDKKAQENAVVDKTEVPTETVPPTVPSLVPNVKNIPKKPQVEVKPTPPLAHLAPKNIPATPPSLNHSRQDFLNEKQRRIEEKKKLDAQNKP
jgi:hypothetical protein